MNLIHCLPDSFENNVNADATRAKEDEALEIDCIIECTYKTDGEGKMMSQMKALLKLILVQFEQLNDML